MAMVLPDILGSRVGIIPFFDRYYEDKIIEALSIFVWYMDKNRPLPPGTEFDKFRQKDFERRKAEGFHLPLFKSMIPTPESTKEQQTEREKYWKD
ncbi:hypothetical protein [Ancylomarina sp. 16SWW S1-10-2]|uniref:hypothetical protein n=1 Tax=Ancylomarina sp. 16SWW S1-10-2 TaxID=2499681 RepID=UPI00189EEA0F|nr:hypothetical protein [Ancylomarina sp. 16SWW S1-10-2]